MLFLDQIKREKGVWWMPWQQEAMKDVILCDKPWLAENRRLTHGSPNGATHLNVSCCPAALPHEDESPKVAGRGINRKHEQVFST